MTNPAHPSARQKAAALRVVAFFCAAITLMLTLSACSTRAKETATTRGAMPPVFPLNGSLREAAPDAPALFAIPESTRQRAVARTRDGFIAWDSRSKEVTWLDARGSVRARAKLDVAFAWVTEAAILAREAAFTDGKGFAFTLYRVRGTKLIKRWTRELDCFPSDALVISSDEVILAGGDRANERNSVWIVNDKNGAVCVLSVPKNDDFLRLIANGNALVAFSSGREKKKTRIVVYEVPAMANADRANKNAMTASPEPAKAIPIEGLPDTALCPFGYGFAFGGSPVIPVAEADGTVSLALLMREGDAFRVTAVARKSGGCLVPLGEWPDGTYRYLAHDALSTGEDYWLGTFDGSNATLQRLD